MNGTGDGESGSHFSQDRAARSLSASSVRENRGVQWGSEFAFLGGRRTPCVLRSGAF